MISERLGWPLCVLLFKILGGAKRLASEPSARGFGLHPLMIRIWRLQVPAKSPWLLPLLCCRMIVDWRLHADDGARRHCLRAAACIAVFSIAALRNRQIDIAAYDISSSIIAAVIAVLISAFIIEALGNRQSAAFIAAVIIAVFCRARSRRGSLWPGGLRQSSLKSWVGRATAALRCDDCIGPAPWS